MLKFENGNRCALCTPDHLAQLSSVRLHRPTLRTEKISITLTCVGSISPMNRRWNRSHDCRKEPRECIAHVVNWATGLVYRQVFSLQVVNRWGPPGVSRREFGLLWGKRGQRSEPTMNTSSDQSFFLSFRHKFGISTQRWLN